ncbi:MAG: hypothetical protein U5L72_16220 [Bacteroidales bacterium]|nr:hypothetical protein [Bacteroidales bacterium]
MLRGAVLDVWRESPKPTGDWWNWYEPHPHIAGYSVDGKANATS